MVNKARGQLNVPVIIHNPIIQGQYADPDLKYYEGKYWLYPTTDGFEEWSGKSFKVFSSDDLVKWTDEGVILEEGSLNPGKNIKGIQIAGSTWAQGYAWAPCSEERNGKYYFYYCGKDEDGVSAIGVASADNPYGPYIDKEGPLITLAMCKAAGISLAQVIDPAIFVDDDGQPYMLFGNGCAAIVMLAEDMMNIKLETLKPIGGLVDFRESVTLFKKDGRYHWLWSCDDTGSPDYHVRYGISETNLRELMLAPDNEQIEVTYIKVLLKRDDSNGILGTAHQSTPLLVIDREGNEHCILAYHRFFTPLNTYITGLGYHREVCIGEIEFDTNGFMEEIQPTR